MYTSLFFSSAISLYGERYVVLWFTRNEITHVRSMHTDDGTPVSRGCPALTQEVVMRRRLGTRCYLLTHPMALPLIAASQVASAQVSIPPTAEDTTQSSGSQHELLKDFLKR